MHAKIREAIYIYSNYNNLISSFPLPPAHANVNIYGGKRILIPFTWSNGLLCRFDVLFNAFLGGYCRIMCLVLSYHGECGH